MKSGVYIGLGTVILMAITLFTLSSVMRGPGPDAPGEATNSIFGVVVDRVVIPADPDGRAGLPNDRIRQGRLATLFGAALTSGVLGGLIGWGIGKARRRQRQAEAGVVGMSR